MRLESRVKNLVVKFTETGMLGKEKKSKIDVMLKRRGFAAGLRNLKLDMRNLDLGHQLQGNEEATKTENKVEKRRKLRANFRDYLHFGGVRKETTVREWKWRGD